MSQRHPSRVPDYTNANLVLIFVNLCWIFGVVWMHWGLGAAIVLAVALNHGITRLESYRARRAVESIRRGKADYEEA